jgi:hypothetical protein
LVDVVPCSLDHLAEGVTEITIVVHDQDALGMVEQGHAIR